MDSRVTAFTYLANAFDNISRTVIADCTRNPRTGKLQISKIDLETLSMKELKREMVKMSGKKWDKLPDDARMGLLLKNGAAGREGTDEWIPVVVGLRMNILFTNIDEVMKKLFE